MSQSTPSLRRLVFVISSFSFLYVSAILPILSKKEPMYEVSHHLSSLYNLLLKLSFYCFLALLNIRLLCRPISHRSFTSHPVTCRLMNRPCGLHRPHGCQLVRQFCPSPRDLCGMYRRTLSGCLLVVNPRKLALPACIHCCRRFSRRSTKHT